MLRKKIYKGKYPILPRNIINHITILHKFAINLKFFTLIYTVGGEPSWIIVLVIINNIVEIAGFIFIATFIDVFLIMFLFIIRKNK